IKEINRKIENINKYNQEVEHLEFNGLNLTRWRSRATKAVYIMTGISRCWDLDRLAKDSLLDLAVNRCATCMIWSTIHTELRDLINDCDYAHAAMLILEGHF
ncbi:hypothetical protein CROQUDRAFT_11231, partial [Cronartium quercuum f. sp. fusiforme G11]